MKIVLYSIYLLEKWKNQDKITRNGILEAIDKTISMLSCGFTESNYQCNNLIKFKVNNKKVDQLIIT